MIKATIKPEDLNVDVVICTHNHLDHLDVDAIPRMDLKKIMFLVPSDAVPKLEELGAEKIKPFDEGERIWVGDFELEAVFADHTVPAIGVLVHHGGKTLYFSGDTYYHEKLEKLKTENIDFLFICINGKLGNMNVDEAARLTSIISPKVAIPNHYGMFESNTEDPQRYISQIKNGFEMEPGKEYEVKECLI